MLPFGIIDDGQENETIVDSEGTRWGVVETQRNYFRATITKPKIICFWSSFLYRLN